MMLLDAKDVVDRVEDLIQLHIVKAVLKPEPPELQQDIEQTKVQLLRALTVGSH